MPQIIRTLQWIHIRQNLTPRHHCIVSAHELGSSSDPRSQQDSV